MRIRHLERHPFHEMPYLNAARDGSLTAARLQFMRGFVDRMPEGVDAIIVACDLQGRVDGSGSDVSVGTMFADALLSEIVSSGSSLGLPSSQGIGMWPAIELTTAASVCAMVDLHRLGKLPQKGFVKQEDCSLPMFNETIFGLAYENPTGLEKAVLG